MKPLAQFLGAVVAVGPALAGEHYSGGGDTGETSEPDELPAHAHRRRRLIGAVNDSGLVLEDAVATASTGDIWLFRGTSFSDRTIRAATNSPVNHVGMAVAIDDLPPLLWHAELGRSLPDVWTGERHRGVQLHLLGEAVRTWNARYKQRAWLRQLDGEIERDQEDRLMEVINRFDGLPFPTTLGLLRRWLTGRWRGPSRWRPSSALSSSPRRTSTWVFSRARDRRARTTQGGSGAATGSRSSRRITSPQRSRCGDPTERTGAAADPYAAAHVNSRRPDWGTPKEQQRRRSHDHPTRAWWETVDRGNQPCGHDSRVGMGPRQPRPAAGNSGPSRAAALARSRHAP